MPVAGNVTDALSATGLPPIRKIYANQEEFCELPRDRPSGLPRRAGRGVAGPAKGYRTPDRLRRQTDAARDLHSGPVKDREAVRQWAERHDCCQVCGIDEHTARWLQITGLQTHHIIKAGRSDEPCNLLRVCERCHRIIEGESVPDEKGGHWPPLTLAHVLHCKWEYDPQEYDADRLTVLWKHRGRTPAFDPLPRPEPLPAVYIAERLQWLTS